NRYSHNLSIFFKGNFNLARDTAGDNRPVGLEIILLMVYDSNRNIWVLIPESFSMDELRSRIRQPNESSDIYPFQLTGVRDEFRVCGKNSVCVGDENYLVRPNSFRNYESGCVASPSANCTDLPCCRTSHEARDHWNSPPVKERNHMFANPLQT